MTVGISAAAREAYTNTNVTVVYTIELRHPSFITPIRIVRDRKNLSAKLEADAPLNGGETVEFLALGFELKLPGEVQSKLPELTVQIDNIYLETENRRISDYIADTMGSLNQIELTCRTYALGNEQPLDLPFHLILHSVSADSNTVNAKARFFNAQNEVFPRNTYTSEDFPTLYYE